jgi:DMSO/TMAO reductase YedYZ molybdopterin-dependent catalytic subunit
MPADRFYIRNHFPTPLLDPATWRLEVGGCVDRPFTLSLCDLRSMPSHTLVATLECAGNGRSGFEPAIAGEPWRLGAVSTAEWTGVPLVEVLDRAMPRREAVELLVRGADAGATEGRTVPIAFERSLPLAEARRPEVLLAYAMNGEPLPLNHGRPVRLVVPGWYAVASVKWITEIELVDAAFDGFFQSDRYVYEWHRDGITVRQPVGHQHVRALVVEPATGAEVRAGEVMVRGTAWSGGGPIALVEVRVNDEPWQRARMIGEPHPHGWQWWELIVRLQAGGPIEIRARATDTAGRVQPERAEWNRLGYGNNSIQVVPIRVR